MTTFEGLELGKYFLEMKQSIKRYPECLPRIMVDHFFNVTGIGTLYLASSHRARSCMTALYYFTEWL
jgi:selenocysteine-specific translation elongation factor